jgi:hypothetical protein
MSPDPAPRPAPPNPKVDHHGSASRPAPPALSGSDAPRPLRWMDPLTTLFVLGAITIVAVTASPHVLRAAGMGPPPSVGFGSGARLGARPLPTAFSHPEYAPHERPVLQDAQPAPRVIAPPIDEGGLDFDSDRFGFGTVRRATELHAKAEANAETTGLLKAGSLVMIVQESGEWAFVLYNGAANGAPKAGMVVGWIKKSEIAIR